MELELGYPVDCKTEEIESILAMDEEHQSSLYKMKGQTPRSH
jgi:hypothetical protein